MPYATDADLLARIPALSAVDPARRLLALADTEVRIDLAVVGARDVWMHVLLVAHTLALDPGSGFGAGVGGPVTKRRAGEIEATYAAPSGFVFSGMHSETVWGREYDRIMETVALVGIAV